MTEIRTFIAVDIAPEIVTRLLAVQQHLRQAEAAVSWVRPEGMHLTLKFLGNVDEARMPAIADALAAIARQHRPFSLRVAGTGAFPTLARPRVVWAGVAAGGDELRALAESIETALAALGFPRETRPFRPHLTLGRVKVPPADRRLADGVAAHRDEDFGEMPVTALTLYRSDLSPQGARYTVLCEARLGE